MALSPDGDKEAFVKVDMTSGDGRVVGDSAELQPWTYGKVWTVMALCFAIGFCVGLAVCGV